MKLEEMVDSRLVSFDFPGKTKDEVIKGVAKLVYDAGKVTDYDKYVEAIYQREEEFTTGMGYGVAIPHCKNDCVKTAAFTLVRLSNDIEWGSLDGKPVKYIIMLAAPDSADNIHLEMLAEISSSLMDDDFREGLLKANNMEEICKVLKKEV